MGIEIGAAASSHELKEQSVQRTAKTAELAKQRSQRRTKKAGGDVHRVVRDHGPSLQQASRSAGAVDRGPQKRWRPAFSLPSFEDPPGFGLCWIARHRRRHGDEANLLASLRQGWQFVKPSELDEDDLPTETFTGRLSKHGEVIGDETTVLMKLPNEFKAQRDEHYNGKRDAATKAVTRRRPGLAEATPQMPLVEDKNEVSVDYQRMRARRASRAEAGGEADE